MAIVNKGFPGTVNATEYAKSWHLGGSDACDGTGWLVSQGTGRQTSTAAGDAFAAGVLSENSAPILTPLSTPTNGQWFLIVRRVDWAGAGTVTVVAVSHDTTTTTIPTVAPTTFPTINDDPGVMYDHKLGWAWVRSTDTTMVLFDLRELPLEPRLQVIEGGASRSTGAVFPAATPAALDGISNAAVGDIAQVTLPGTGIDPILFTAVAGSSSTIDWRLRGPIYATTKALLDTATTTITAISDIVLRIGDHAYAADTAITYRWTGSAWKAWESDFISYVATATNLTIGTGGSAIAATSYRYEGGLVRVRYKFILGTSGASIAAAPRFTMPVTGAALAHNYMFYSGQGSLFDTSATALRVAIHIADIASTTIVRIGYQDNIAGGFDYPSATTPWTWAAGDTLQGEFTYAPA